MAVEAAAPTPAREADARHPAEPDWRRVATPVHASRALDALAETRRVPDRKALCRFSRPGRSTDAGSTGCGCPGSSGGPRGRTGGPG